MPRDPAQNQALVAIVRRDLAPPFADPRNLLDELVEDTDPQALARFRAEKFFPSAREERNAQAQDEERRRRAGALTVGAGFWVSPTPFSAVAGSTWFAAVAGPISFPYVIKGFDFSLGNINAAGTTLTRFYTILVSQSEGIDLATLQSDQNLILAGAGFLDGIRRGGITTTGQDTTSGFIPINYVVQNTPTFIKALTDAGGGVGQLDPTIEIQELADVPIVSAKFEAPVGRININLNTSGGRTRGNTPRTPRAARINVTQGGRLINSRVVAWESLRSNIKRDWFNRQVGGAADPNIQWIP